MLICFLVNFVFILLQIRKVKFEDVQCLSECTILYCFILSDHLEACPICLIRINRTNNFTKNVGIVMYTLNFDDLLRISKFPT